MNEDEQFIFIHGAKAEFHWLCNKIVHDGRDPYLVAEAMLEELAKSMRGYQLLWDSAL